METQERICGLCLKLCDNYEAMEGDMRNVMDIVLPKINLATVKEPVICTLCTEMLTKCFDFKTACLCTFDYIVSFVNKNKVRLDLKDVYLSKNVNGTVSVLENQEICGFCMSPVKYCYAISLDVQEKDDMLTKMIEQCLPELDLSLIEKPVVCAPCRGSLENYFRFVTNCLLVEENIQEYCETTGINNRDQIELSSLLQFTKRDVTTSEVNGNSVDIIKEEKQFCEEDENGDEKKIDILGDAFKLEQMFCADSENAIKEENNRLDGIDIEETFCGENETHIKEVHLFDVEDQKSLVNEEIEIKTDEHDVNRFDDGVVLPQPEFTARLYKKRGRLMSILEGDLSCIEHTSTNKNASNTTMNQCECCPSKVTMHNCDSCAHQTNCKGIAAALDSADLVDFLIDNSGYFNNLPLEDKLKIKVARSTPSLLMEKKDSCGKYIRRFQKIWYTNFIWLTGSVIRNRLFCFYCLLFSNSDTEWCKLGVGDESLKNMTAKMKKHECSPHHIYAALKFTQIGTVRIDHALSKAARLAAIKHNTNVDQNRLIVKRLISTTCFLARQELAFRGRDESENSLNKGHYLEILDFLAEEESHMKTHLIHSTVFKGTSSDIQNELIECVTDVVNELILNEVENAHFISVQADETTDVSAESKLSVILRYANVLNGEVEERFVGFHDVLENKPVQGLANVLLSVLKKWKIDENKLVCQTYDGACTMAGKVGGVHTIIRQKYPHALFIHCYAHHLNLVLMHGSKNIKQVKLFMANLTAFHNFFSHSSKRMVLLRKKGFKLPHPSETQWNFYSRGVSTILAHFSELKASIQDVLEKDGWDSDTISLAIGLKRSLTDIQFVFLLQLYDKIFKYTSILFDILQMKNTEVKRCSTEVQNCLYSIKKLRNEETVRMCAEETEKLLSEKSNTLVDDIDVEEGETEYTESLKLKFNDRRLTQMRILSFEIIDSVIVNVESRFQELHKLDFLEILNEENFEFYSASQNFPTNIREKLTKLYPFFDKLKLKGELMFIYGSFDKTMSPKELFKYLINNNLKDVLPETVKLLSLILCIPTTTASCERSMSTLKRIKTFLRNSTTNEHLSNLATLAIEKGLVKTSASQQEFISRTIDVFAEKKTRRMDLIYKKI